MCAFPHLVSLARITLQAPSPLVIRILSPTRRFSSTSLHYQPTIVAVLFSHLPPPIVASSHNLLLRPITFSSHFHQLIDVLVAAPRCLLDHCPAPQWSSLFISNHSRRRVRVSKTFCTTNRINSFLGNPSPTFPVPILPEFSLLASRDELDCVLHRRHVLRARPRYDRPRAHSRSGH